MRFQSLVPMLQTQDVAATRAWYESRLGFTCAAGSHEGWCQLSRDGVSIMFMHNDLMGEPQATATQYITVDDVMALWDRLKEHCVAEWGPERMPYGMLEFAIRDPNGYLLSFGQEVAEAEARA